MTYRKMTEGDIRLILAFVQNFEPESNVLRWRDVEAHSNFTRQALQAHPQIKSAFLAAKERLIQKRPENKELDSSSASVPSSEKVRALTEKISAIGASARDLAKTVVLHCLSYSSARYSNVRC